jgi:hypothetical protein
VQNATGGSEALPDREKYLQSKRKLAAKEGLSHPVTCLQTIFDRFPLSPLTLRLIGKQPHRTQDSLAKKATLPNLTKLFHGL